MFNINEHGVVLNPNKHIVYQGKGYCNAIIHTACNDKGRWYGASSMSGHRWGNSSPVMFMHESFTTEEDCVENYLEGMKNSSSLKEPSEQKRLKQMIKAINEFQPRFKQGNLFDL